MLLCLQICFWVNGWNLVIDSSHSFWKYFMTPCAFSKDKIPPWKSKLLTNTTRHLTIHEYTAVSLACLPVSYCWHFAWVHRTSSEVCLVMSVLTLPSWIISSLPVSKALSLADITHVAKSVRSVRCGLSGVKRGINESTVKHLNYFYNRIILVLLYQNDVKVNSGLVYLYMYMHCDIHSGTSLSTLRSQAWLRNHVT